MLKLSDAGIKDGWIGFHTSLLFRIIHRVQSTCLSAPHCATICTGKITTSTYHSSQHIIFIITITITIIITAAVKLMFSVSVSFRSAKAAVNDNETGYRRQYTQSPTSLPSNSTALGTWSAGKVSDALSKLVTGSIFHVQKLIYAGGG